MSLSLETERLRLRAWQFQDYFPFFEMNIDPKVMQYFPKLLLKQESDASTCNCSKWLGILGH